MKGKRHTRQNIKEANVVRQAKTVEKNELI